METPKLLVLDSYSMGSRFGNDCPVCEKKVVYQQAQALCNCPIFYHNHCFLNEINQKPINTKPQLKCLYCQELFQVEYDQKVQVYFKKRLTPHSIIVITALVVLLGLIIFLGVKAFSLLNHDNIDDNLIGIYYCLGMFFGIIGMTFLITRLFVLACMQESVTAIQVKHIQRSIEFSAFKDLGFIEENSDCTMIH